MHLKNTVKSKIKFDKVGDEYTEEFQAAYGIPSLYVHGEPLLIPEIFKNANDDADWRIREGYTYFDTLSMVNSAFTHLLNFSVKTTAGYGLDIQRLRALRAHVKRVINTTAMVHGSPRRLVETPR